MRNYHYYMLDSMYRLIQRPIIVPCASDRAAINEATRALRRDVVEVWDYDRFVARLEPETGGEARLIH